MDPKDNPQGEPVSAPTPESSAAPQAPGSAVEPAKVEPAKAVEDVEQLKKDLEKVRMELGQKTNKLKEFETAKEEARKAELSEVDRLKEELAQANQDKAQREAQDFRNKVLEDYLKDSPSALKAAKALIAKNPLNLVWTNGVSEEDAKAELIDQLDALKEVVGETGEKKPAQSKPRSNNPNVRDDDPDRAAMVVEARKSGDFSKLIHSFPSVQAQRKTFETE